MQKTKGFTLIELLIVIAIIAVLAVVVVLTLNPAELLRQARDSTRLSDVASINGALAFYLADVPVGFGASGAGGAGSSLSTGCFAYVNPTSTITCSTMGFGVDTTVSNVSDLRTVDGTGWIPLDFSSVSTGSPFGILPVDPVNSTSTELYYRAAFTTTTYKVVALMESTKFSTGTSNVMNSDGGPDNSLLEAGSDLSL
jgi:prepilin-type N-terminal cleavage/methylation domain-containing protein